MSRPLVGGSHHYVKKRQRNMWDMSDAYEGATKTHVVRMRQRMNTKSSRTVLCSFACTSFNILLLEVFLPSLFCRKFHYMITHNARLARVFFHCSIKSLWGYIHKVNGKNWSIVWSKTSSHCYIPSKVRNKVQLSNSDFKSFWGKWVVRGWQRNFAHSYVAK